MLGEPLRQDDQYGPCGRIVDREEGLQELEGVASDRFRLRRRYVQHGRTPRCGRAVSRSNAAGRLQLDYIATLEGSRPLDLATRHHALPMSETLHKMPTWMRRSYAAARLSLTTLSFFIR